MPHLNRLYSTDNRSFPGADLFRPEWLGMLLDRSDFVALPTEQVVRRASDLRLRTARYWWGLLRCGTRRDGTHFVVDQRWTHVPDPSQRTFRQRIFGWPRVYLIERWLDDGSDGHVDFHHIGWSFVAEEDITDDQGRSDELKLLAHITSYRGVYGEE